MSFKLTLIGFIAAAAYVVSGESSFFSLFQKAQDVAQPESLVNRGYIGYCDSRNFGKYAARYNNGDQFQCNDGSLNWNCWVFTGGYSCSGSNGLKTFNLLSNTPAVEDDKALSLYNYGNVGKCNANTIPQIASKYVGNNQFQCTDGHSTWYCTMQGIYYSCNKYGLILADNSTIDAQPESLINRGYIGTCRSQDLGSISRRYNSGDVFQCQDGRTRWTCTSFAYSGYSCSGTTYKQDFLQSLANYNSTEATPATQAQTLVNRGYQGYCSTSSQRSTIAGRYNSGDTFQCSGGSTTWTCQVTSWGYTCFGSSFINTDEGQVFLQSARLE